MNKLYRLFFGFFFLAFSVPNMASNKWFIAVRRSNRFFSSFSRKNLNTYCLSDKKYFSKMLHDSHSNPPRLPKSYFFFFGGIIMGGFFGFGGTYYVMKEKIDELEKKISSYPKCTDCDQLISETNKSKKENDQLKTKISKSKEENDQLRAEISKLCYKKFLALPGEVDRELIHACMSIKNASKDKESIQKEYKQFVRQTLDFLFEHKDILIEQCEKDIEDKIEKGYFMGYYPELMSYTYGDKGFFLIEKLLGCIPYKNNEEAWKELFSEKNRLPYRDAFSKGNPSIEQLKESERKWLKSYVEMDRKYAFKKEFQDYLVEILDDQYDYVGEYLNECASSLDFYDRLEEKERVLEKFVLEIKHKNTLEEINEFLNDEDTKTRKSEIENFIINKEEKFFEKNYFRSLEFAYKWNRWKKYAKYCNQ